MSFPLYCITNRHLYALPFLEQLDRILALRPAGVILREKDLSLEEYLALAGWEDAFDQVVTGYMVQNGKPAPDIYLLGARELDATPCECLGVEDSVNGVKAVRAAGMRCAMIPDVLPYTQGLAPYVDMLLSDLSEVEAIIEKER